MKADRHEKAKKKGAAIWLTGMSGAGKTTLGLRLQDNLQGRQSQVKLLDGDLVRARFSKDLGFSREDRIKNLERVIGITDLLVKNQVTVICCFIAPFEEIRRLARESIDNYVEVYVKCPLEVLVSRDPKGLYKKALSGEIDNFTGITDPFEEPASYDICVETDKESEEESFQKIIGWLEINNLISFPAAACEEVFQRAVR